MSIAVTPAEALPGDVMEHQVGDLRHRENECEVEEQLQVAHRPLIWFLRLAVVAVAAGGHDRRPSSPVIFVCDNIFTVLEADALPPNVDANTRRVCQLCDDIASRELH
jgi:hypothetical protein